MSDLDLRPSLRECGGRADVLAEPVHELLHPRTVPLGGSTNVRRLLPNLGRRMVGAWCFVDHYGPDDIADLPGMRVPPHPHIGLQTVSWLHAGEVLHRDSLGSEQTILPRRLGLMTAGRGIAHSEQSPATHGAILHGAQLWVALPDAHRHIAPRFEHHSELPVVEAAGLRGIVLLGEVDGAVSPGTVHSPIVGVDLALDGADVRLPVEPDFEYAVLAMSGVTEVDGVRLSPGAMLYLGCGRSGLRLRADGESGLMLLGGEPFEERIVMWWNFIGRTTEEIAEARAAWMAPRSRFGTVHGYAGEPLPAPAMPPGTLKPRGRTR